MNPDSLVCGLRRYAARLLSDGAVAVNPAALKEAVTHHAVTKQKKEDHQEECEQELSGSKRGWIGFCRVGWIR
jgi:hypothetical protein